MRPAKVPVQPVTFRYMGREWIKRGAAWWWNGFLVFPGLPHEWRWYSPRGRQPSAKSYRTKTAAMRAAVSSLAGCR